MGGSVQKTAGFAPSREASPPRTSRGVPRPSLLSYRAPELDADDPIFSFIDNPDSLRKSMVGPEAISDAARAGSLIDKAASNLAALAAAPPTLVRALSRIGSGEVGPGGEGSGQEATQTLAQRSRAHSAHPILRVGPGPARSIGAATDASGPGSTTISPAVSVGLARAAPEHGSMSTSTSAQQVHHVHSGGMQRGSVNGAGESGAPPLHHRRLSALAPPGPGEGTIAAQSMNRMKRRQSIPMNFAQNIQGYLQTPDGDGASFIRVGKSDSRGGGGGGWSGLASTAEAEGPGATPVKGLTRLKSGECPMYILFLRLLFFVFCLNVVIQWFLAPN